MARRRRNAIEHQATDLAKAFSGGAVELVFSHLGDMDPAARDLTVAIVTNELTPAKRDAWLRWLRKEARAEAAQTTED